MKNYLLLLFLFISFNASAQWGSQAPVDRSVSTEELECDDILGVATDETDGSNDDAGNRWENFRYATVGQFTGCPIRPEQFGVIADDGLDDATKFNATVTHALANNACILVSDGEYDFATPVIFDVSTGTQNPCIIGQSINGTVFQPLNGFTGSAIFTSTGHDAPTYSRRLERGYFAHFRVKGNKPDASQIDHGIDFEALAEVEFYNVRVTDALYNCWHIGWNFTNKWDNSKGQSCKNGLYVHSEVNNANIIIGSTFLSNEVGINMPEGGNGITLLANDVENNSVAGIYLGGIDGITIDGYFESNGATGFTFDGVNGGAIDGNWPVNPDIVINGGVSGTVSPWDVVTDMDTLPKAENVTIKGFTTNDNNDFVVVAQGENITVNHTGKSKTVVALHGTENYVKELTIKGVLPENALTAVTVENPNVANQNRMSSLISSDWNFAEFGIGNFDKANFSIISGSGGDWAYQGYDLYGSPVYAIENVSGTTAYYGTSISLSDYPQLKDKFVILEFDLLHLTDNFNSSNYSTGAQLYATSSDGVRTGHASVDRHSIYDVETTGSITTGTNSLTVADASNIGIGDPIIVDDAGSSGEVLVTTVTNVSGVTVTLEDNASSTVTSELVRVPGIATTSMTFLMPDSGTVNLGARRILGSVSDKMAVVAVRLKEVGASNDSLISLKNTIDSYDAVDARTLTAQDCGKTIFLNSATEFATTLPDEISGCTLKIIVKAAPSGADYTVVTNGSSNVIIGGTNELEVDTGDDGPYDNNGDTITFVDGVSVAGDYVEIESDGTSWYINGQANADGGITITGS